MISYKTFCYKAKARIHRDLVIASKNKPYYFWFYPSYWHSKLTVKHDTSEVVQYMTARPNPGAGIGHQISNWLAGYNMAAYYSMPYSTYPFSDLSNPLVSNEWDFFLGLNKNEVSTESLAKQGYKKVLLPRIDFDSVEECNLLRKIMDSYKGKKIVFLLEMDQGAGSELNSLEFMRKKYWSSPERNKDVMEFNPENFNVAVHIRRGDIVQKGTKKNDNLTMRWLDVSYYIEMLNKYLEVYSCGKNVSIYLFSQANENELQGFDKFGEVIYCNKMNAINSFLHMANADMLVMSRSGMSYQAAKLNKNGIIIYPSGFWHESVDSEKWINS
jgi:hypothetical protein